ncbi:MAG: nucleotidyltransferase domain-containing protein [Candidatus Pacebacteria bacterium]|nr:nucleotidyltransferase domain-containing protein [Candidatus Paceibacterota bacterium]
MTENNKKIINLLADYPSRQFFTKEISDKTKISLGGAHNSLKDLEKERMIFMEQRGNMKFFQINLHNPLVRQMRTALAVNKLSGIVEKIKKYSKEIILFGSACRGEQSAESDFDLFVLTNNYKEVKEVIKKERKKLLINPVIKTPNEWGEMEIKEPEFYLEVKKGIKLYEQTF